MKDFLGNELNVGDLIIINKNTQTGSSTSRKILYKTKVERLTKLQVVTENFGYIYPDNVIKIPDFKKLEEKYCTQLELWQGVDVDPVDAHSESDKILCNLLKELGFEKLLEAYNKVDKCYRYL